MITVIMTGNRCVQSTNCESTFYIRKLRGSCMVSRYDEADQTGSEI